MANTVKIKGRTYIVREFDFNAACELAEKGFDIFNSEDTSILKRIRAIVAWVLNIDMLSAGNIVQEHIIEGGSFDEITNAFNVALEESGFLKGLRDSMEEEAEDKKKTTAKK